MPVTCRCGCGAAIARTRTFVNKDHQIAWLRAEAAKRRRGKAQAQRTAAVETPPASAVAVEIQTPPTSAVAVEAPPPSAVALEIPQPSAVEIAPDVLPDHGSSTIPAAPVEPAGVLPIALASISVGSAERAERAERAGRAEGAEAEDEPEPEPETLSLTGEIYVVGTMVTGLPVFCGVWLFCLAVFGLPLGGGLGWLPALGAAALAGATWPLMLAAGLTMLIILV